VKLQFLPANQAWAFTFGDTLIRLGNYEMFYANRASAVTAARHHGLTVDKKGAVS
jgi:hypothetical protein